MRKLVTRFLALAILVATIAPATMAASVSEPVPASVPATPASGTPDSNTVKAALSEFKSLSRSDKKSRFKDAKKLFKQYRKARREMDPDAKLILLAILAILLPPLAVFLKEGEADLKFWISLILTLLCFIAFPLWFVGVVFALLVVFDLI